MLKHRQYVCIYIFSRETLNETFTAKYDGVLPGTPLLRPKSKFTPPKRDDEHPHPFHMLSFPPSPPGVNRDIENRQQRKVKTWARSIQPKFPEISVQNSMDRFGPTGKVSKKRVHLLRWTTFAGWTGWNLG